MNQEQVKTFADLLTFCAIHGLGQTIQFTDEVELADCDPHFGPSMMAKIHGVNFIDGGISITLNFQEFHEHNRKVATPCFFDDEGNPSLTWQESKVYPLNHMETVWVESYAEIFFKFVEAPNINVEQLKANILKLEKIVAPREAGSISLADSPESLLICLREYVKETKTILGIGG